MARRKKHRRRTKRKKSCGCALRDATPCSPNVERYVHIALERAGDLDEHNTHFRRANRFAWDALAKMHEGDCDGAGDMAKAAIKLAAG